MRKINQNMLSDLITYHANQNINEGKLSEAEITVIQEGESIFHQRFGTFNSLRTPFPERTMYRLASMTKPITAVAVLQLAEKGKIDLDAPVYDYIPEFKDMDIGVVENDQIIRTRKAVGVLRVYELLTHTNGIGTYPMVELQTKDTKEIASVKEMAEYYSKQPVEFDPGTKTNYSPSAAFDVAARIIEIVTDKPYSDNLKENIFDPLGMIDTTFDPNEEQWTRMVSMHNRTSDGKSFDAEMPKGIVFGGMKPSCCAAGAGLASTSNDYIIFAEMLQNNGIGPDGCRIIGEKMIRRMRTAHVSEYIMPGSVQWGLGVRVINHEYSKPRQIQKESFGWSGAYGTHFWVDPINKITALYMKNSIYDGGAGSMTGNQFENDVYFSLV